MNHLQALQSWAKWYLSSSCGKLHLVCKKKKAKRVSFLPVDKFVSYLKFEHGKIFPQQNSIFSCLIQINSKCHSCHKIWFCFEKHEWQVSRILVQIFPKALNVLSWTAIANSAGRASRPFSSAYSHSWVRPQNGEPHHNAADSCLIRKSNTK